MYYRRRAEAHRNWNGKTKTKKEMRLAHKKFEGLAKARLRER